MSIERLQTSISRISSVLAKIPKSLRSISESTTCKNSLFKSNHASERPEGLEHMASESEIKRLTEKKVFLVLKSNKKDFNPNEMVTLKLQMKNIDQVGVKVFQSR